MRVYERAAKVQKGQIWLKRVVAEMGGKDAIIVDADTDLDDAAAGVVASAFGFQGQKCSACSRAIIVGEAYEPVEFGLLLRRPKLRVIEVLPAAGAVYTSRLQLGARRR